MEVAYRTALACLPGMNVLSLPSLLQLAGGAKELWGILAGGGARAAALVGQERAGAWSDACVRTDPREMLKGLESMGIRALVPKDPGFPERLRAIYDPPALLFVRGGQLPTDTPFVAVVGSRRASSYGRWAAETMGGELARRGIVVVSGAAYGVDGHAHAGCLKEGGFTVAVLGCGIDVAYPSEHTGLLRRIASSGCVLSEYPPGDVPLPWRFPHRNRIIAGLSHAVVVVEASRKSGALITADLALEEGREVMAVPGPIGSPISQGTNGLIQKGAKLVMSAEDICEELPPEFVCWPKAGEGAEPAGGMRDGEDIDPLERECLELLQGEPLGLDSLAASTGIDAQELLACISSMSIKGWIGAEAGGRYRLLINPAFQEIKSNNNKIKK